VITPVAQCAVRPSMQDNSTEKLVRAVGFWGLVAMCINAVVGSGVFLLPTESYKLLGPFSALGAADFCAAGIHPRALFRRGPPSHFSEPGGAYLYAKTAFGDFVGFETGWDELAGACHVRWRRSRMDSSCR